MLSTTDTSWITFARPGYVRAAHHSGDAARRISADIVMVDEVQDVAGGNLPVTMEFAVAFKARSHNSD